MDKVSFFLNSGKGYSIPIETVEIVKKIKNGEKNIEVSKLTKTCYSELLIILIL